MPPMKATSEVVMAYKNQDDKAAWTAAYQKLPYVKEQRKAINKRSYAKNRKKRRELAKKYRNNPNKIAKIKAYKVKYWQQHRDQRKAWDKARYARRCEYKNKLLNQRFFNKEIEKCKTDKEKLRLCAIALKAIRILKRKDREALRLLRLE